MRHACRLIAVAALAVVGVNAPVFAVDAASAVKPDRKVPVVFAHGCPVPRELGGSGTNYVTSLYWRDLYEYFRVVGSYPARRWDVSDVTQDGAITFDDVVNAPKPRIPRTVEAETGDTGTSQLPGPRQFLNIFVMQHAQCGGSEQYAEELAAYVAEVRARTRSARVDIVANSMGGMAVRWYMKHLGGSAFVRRIVLLAPTSHGTDVAVVTSEHADLAPFRSPHYDGARDAFPAYDCSEGSFQQRLYGDACEGPVFVGGETLRSCKEANDEETCWVVLYNTWLDELHQPNATSCLNQRFVGDCSDLAINIPLQNLPGAACRDPSDPQSIVLPCADNGEPHGSYRLNSVVVRETFRWIVGTGADVPAPVDLGLP